ncbi:putative RNA-binding protein 18 [Leucoagaricus sp. SymC.cos]|nr:putative RNA-binding protein 18 [Leucoagaricus sp. SymC.cos]
MDTTSDDSLDHFIAGPSTESPQPSIPIDTSVNELLSYPSLDPEEQSPRQGDSSHSQSPALFKDRIYVGNLHPSVDEYTLVQVFSKFGKITSVDYLFHKSGPLKGKPRGYAFVKYADESDAQKAMSTAHDKLLRGRKIVVTYAHHVPPDSVGGSGGKSRRVMMEISRPTTLSLLKSGSTSRPLGTAAKIAKMEAKLRQLESSSTGTPPNVPPLHPSLPPKPQTSPVEMQSHGQARSTAPRGSRLNTRAITDKPPPSLTKFSSSSLTSPPLPSSTAAAKPNKPKPKLLGVKIKPKDKDKSSVAPAVATVPKSD